MTRYREGVKYFGFVDKSILDKMMLLRIDRSLNIKNEIVIRIFENRFEKT